MVKKLEKVLVASANPVKIEACKNAFLKVFPERHFDFIGISVKSGVSDQPIGLEETYRGAKNRVTTLIKNENEASFFVGMEGGIRKMNDQYFAFAWMFVKSKEGLIGKAQTAHFQLPPPVVELLENGYELGDADDKIFGKRNSKQKSGAVGLLTADLIDRSQYYEHAMVLALIPFKNTDLF